MSDAMQEQPKRDRATIKAECDVVFRRAGELEYQKRIIEAELHALYQRALSLNQEAAQAPAGASS